MAEYKGSVSLISGLQQANKGTFPLVDASAVNITLNEDGSPRSTSTMPDRLDSILVSLFNNSSSFKLEFVDTLPVPNASQWGKMIILTNEATQTDDILICLRTSGSYSWRSLTSGKASEPSQDNTLDNFILDTSILG